MKKILIILIILLVIPFNVEALKKEPIKVHIFKGDGCRYCNEALKFFESIEDKYGKYFEIVEHEVWHDADNAALMTKVAEYFNEEINGVPYIIIGDKTFEGYSEEYDDEIIDAITSAYNNINFIDRVEAISKKENNSANKNKYKPSKYNNKDSFGISGILKLFMQIIFGLIA